MATAKIWHYAVGLGDLGSQYPDLPTEPYLSRQSVTTSGTAASSTAAPYGANLARVEVTVATRYRVNLAGVSVVAADASDVPLFLNTTNLINYINLPAGATISLIEAA